MSKIYPLQAFIRYRAAVAISVINKRVDELAHKSDIDIAKMVAIARWRVYG